MISFITNANFLKINHKNGSAFTFIIIVFKNCKCKGKIKHGHLFSKHITEFVIIALICCPGCKGNELTINSTLPDNWNSYEHDSIYLDAPMFILGHFNHLLHGTMSCFLVASLDEL